MHLFHIHIQNIVSYHFILRRMIQKISRFVLLIKISKKEDSDLAFIPDNIVEDIHKGTVPDQNVQNDAVVKHLDPVGHIRRKDTEITLF